MVLLFHSFTAVGVTFFAPPPLFALPLFRVRRDCWRQLFSLLFLLLLLLSK